MGGRRRFSQAISEGDGISFLAEIKSADAARAAEADGAEALLVRGALAGLRDASELPILWGVHDGTAGDAERAGADAYVLVVERFDHEDDRLERALQEGTALGLDCVVAVGDEDELRMALDRLDPEILLLSARDAGGDEALEQVLSLLPDVPAGKLAIAELEVGDREEVEELERAGVDAVIVRASHVARLAGPPPPEV